MTDRELLEAAAKAINANVEFTSGCWTFGQKTECRLNDGELWNPLTDDGDALRLAVAIAEKYQFHSITWNWVSRGVQVFADGIEGTGQDTLSATRRAIVSAAAAIGKKL